LVSQDPLVYKESLGNRDPLDQRDQRDTGDSLDCKDCLDPLVLLEKEGCQEPMGRMVSLALLEQEVLQVWMALLA
jgi:hypothetical protein